MQSEQKNNPYETIDSRVWTVERRLAKLEIAVDNIDARIHNIERSVSDLQAQMTRNGWILVALVIVSSTLFGVMF
tara:strand:- start:1539 stop:1763 length:225 start_codon:yes stop_codon:yes gene_type:complete